MESRHRRRFMVATGAALVSGAAGAWLWSRRGAPARKNLLLGPASPAGSETYGLGVIDIEAGRAAVIPTGIRGHSAFLRPNSPGTAFMCAQRPGRVSCELDLVAGVKTREIEARPGHHFYGHGAYSTDGSVLFTTENDFDNERGVISVRDATTLKVLEELDTHGVGPHELYLLDGGKTAVVANGGLKTSPRHGDGYEPYALEQMASSLAIFELASGKLLDRVVLKNPKLSIRHLSVSSRGVVAMAIQNKEQGSAFSGGPLVCVRRTDGTVVELVDGGLYSRMKHHTLSVALDEERGIVGTTSPDGDLVVFWDIETGRPNQTFSTKAPSGLCLTADRGSYIVTTRAGRIHTIDATTLVERNGRVSAGTAGNWGSHLTSVMAALA